MRLRTHLWTSALAGLALYPRSPRRAALVCLAGVLIDLDHLLLYSLRSGDWSVIGALQYDRYRNGPIVSGDTRPHYGSLRSCLHNPAILPLFALLAWEWPALRPILAGFTLHLTLDNIDLPREYRLLWRAGGCCAWCRERSKLRVYDIIHFTADGRQARTSYALCYRCYQNYLRGLIPILPIPVDDPA